MLGETLPSQGNPVPVQHQQIRSPPSHTWRLKMENTGFPFSSIDHSFSCTLCSSSYMHHTAQL